MMVSTLQFGLRSKGLGLVIPWGFYMGTKVILPPLSLLRTPRLCFKIYSYLIILILLIIS